jgi:hypothetical protein
MISILNILFYHPVSEATPNSKITGAYFAPDIGGSWLLLTGGGAGVLLHGQAVATRLQPVQQTFFPPANRKKISVLLSSVGDP